MDKCTTIETCTKMVTQIQNASSKFYFRNEFLILLVTTRARKEKYLDRDQNHALIK